MTKDQLEEYKKTAKVGDRIKCGFYGNVWYIRAVHEHGIQMSLHPKYSDHDTFMNWSWLIEYDIIHKEL